MVVSFVENTLTGKIFKKHRLSYPVVVKKNSFKMLSISWQSFVSNAIPDNLDRRRRKRLTIVKIARNLIGSMKIDL